MVVPFNEVICITVLCPSRCRRADDLTGDWRTYKLPSASKDGHFLKYPRIQHTLATGDFRTYVVKHLTAQTLFYSLFKDGQSNVISRMLTP